MYLAAFDNKPMDYHPGLRHNNNSLNATQSYTMPLIRMNWDKDLDIFYLCKPN